MGSLQVPDEPGDALCNTVGEALRGGRSVDTSRVQNFLFNIVEKDTKLHRKIFLEMVKSWNYCLLRNIVFIFLMEAL